MNRTDRLLAIVLELQAQHTRRAEDLAVTFEVSKRTIYRDIQSLCEAGVPVVAIPGQGYSLVEGYFLPPLRFSSDEAMMLLLGSDVMEQSFDAVYQMAAQSASRKIANVLAPELRDEVRVLQTSLRFVMGTGSDMPDATEHLKLLRRVIVNHNTVRFCYCPRRSERQLPQTREIDPYGLVHVEHAWYVTGYCHLRQDLRNFRLDRIEQLVVLNQTFVRPPNFQLQQRVRTRDVVVRALFDQSVARWVQEERFFYITSKELCTNGLLVTLHVYQEKEVVQWLLGWGRHVCILEPESLRDRLIEEATAIQKMYQNPDPLLT